MRWLPLLLAAAPALSAHMISMSTGDLAVRGNRAHYELRMPLYEIAHVRNPEQSLLAHLRFSSGGRAARLITRTCREDQAAGSYDCAADYEFDNPGDSLDVECTFYSITVPNHVHLLRAERDGRRDQALFDLSFSKATLRFSPPGAARIAFEQAAAGFGRALDGLVQILFLAALVLAARSRRELLALAGMFILGQAAAVLLLPATNWVPAARFVEAAAALTVAYLAVEILMLPKGGGRWLILGVLGLFHGLYLALFVETSGFHAGYVLAGAGLADLLAITLLAFVLSRLARLAAALRPIQVSASGLLAFGMFWFFLRLRS